MKKTLGLLSLLTIVNVVLGKDLYINTEDMKAKCGSAFMELDLSLHEGCEISFGALKDKFSLSDNDCIYIEGEKRISLYDFDFGCSFESKSPVIVYTTSSDVLFKNRATFYDDSAIIYVSDTQEPNYNRSELDDILSTWKENNKGQKKCLLNYCDLSKDIDLTSNLFSIVNHNYIRANNIILNDSSLTNYGEINCGNLQKNGTSEIDNQGKLFVENYKNNMLNKFSEENKNIFNSLSSKEQKYFCEWTNYGETLDYYERPAKSSIVENYLDKKSIVGLAIGNNFQRLLVFILKLAYDRENKLTIKDESKSMKTNCNWLAKTYKDISTQDTEITEINELISQINYSGNNELFKNILNLSDPSCYDETPIFRVIRNFLDKKPGTEDFFIYMNMMKVLLMLNCDVNAKDNSNLTPLAYMLTCTVTNTEKKEEVAKLLMFVMLELIEHGADITSDVQPEGYSQKFTLSEWAYERGWYNIAELIDYLVLIKDKQERLTFVKKLLNGKMPEYLDVSFKIFWDTAGNTAQSEEAVILSEVVKRALNVTVDNPTIYDILGVNSSDSKIDMIKKLKKLFLYWHPDKYQDDKNLASEVTNVLIQIKNKLKNTNNMAAENVQNVKPLAIEP